jgi:hypothetical protein
MGKFLSIGTLLPGLGPAMAGDGRGWGRASFAKTRTLPEHSEPSILVVVTGNFLHERHDPAPQGGIINSHERSDQP